MHRKKKGSSSYVKVLSKVEVPKITSKASQNDIR